MSAQEDFLREMAIEASKLERLARQLREGKWETFDLEEFVRPSKDGSRQEKLVVRIRLSRLQKYGTGLDVTLDEEPA